MKKQCYFPKTDEEIMSAITTAHGETILNPSYIGFALTIRENKFIAMDIDGTTWDFDTFEQVCYFMVAAASYCDRDKVKEKTLELFPSK